MADTLGQNFTGIRCEVETKVELLSVAREIRVEHNTILANTH